MTPLHRKRGARAGCAQEDYSPQQFGVPTWVDREKKWAASVKVALGSCVCLARRDPEELQVAAGQNREVSVKS